MPQPFPTNHNPGGNLQLELQAQISYTGQTHPNPPEYEAPTMKDRETTQDAKTSREAVKHDAGKAPLHLVDTYFIESTARVLEYGAHKYDAWNWARGTFEWSRLYSALQRHLQAFWAGEEIDPESGLPHLAHAACCLMFMHRYAASGMGHDDRHRLPAVQGAYAEALSSSPSAPVNVFPPDYNPTPPREERKLPVVPDLADEFKQILRTKGNGGS
jgi:hypothetical protein